MKFIIHRTWFVVTMIVLSCLLSNMTDAHGVSAADYQQRYGQDIQTILSSRLGMQSAIDFVDAHPEIFPAAKVDGEAHRLNREQRLIVWQSWKNFLDHVLFFDSMGHMYAGVYLTHHGKAKKEKPFFTGLRVKRWIEEQGGEDRTLDDLLQNKYPMKYQLSVTPQEEKHIPPFWRQLPKGSHSPLSNILRLQTPSSCFGPIFPRKILLSHNQGLSLQWKAL